MDYLIKKSDGSIVETFPGGATKIKLPEQTGGDTTFVGADERPLALGDYVLVKAIEVAEPLDTTTKRGSTTTAVAGETVTVTRTAIAKDSTDILNDWQAAMSASDRTLISREMESHLEKEHGGVTADTYLQKRYNDKKALRATKPK